MASEVDICNLALSNIRAGSINSLTQSTLQAQICRLKYPILREQLLRDAPWQFARKLEALAVTTIDLFNWSYAYAYPSDCLKIRVLILNYEQYGQGDANRTTLYRDEIYQLQPDADTQIKYRVFNQDGTKVIAANEPDLRAEYTVSVTDPNLFDSLFVQTLSHLLASEIAIPIVGTEKGRQLRSDELQIYDTYLKAAISADSDEQYEVQTESDFIKVRSS